MKIIRRNSFILVTLIVLIAFSILFVCLSKPTDLWSTGVTFIATFLSVTLGAIFSILIYDYQQQLKDNQTLESLKKCLQGEITDIYDVLKNGESLTINGLKFVVTYIQPITLEKSAQTGLFESYEIENFLHIARKIRFYNLQIQYLFSILSNPKDENFTDVLSHCCTNIENTKKGITSNLEQLLKQLGMNFSDSIKSKRRS